MVEKKVLAIIVLVVIASLSVAGCTFPITSSPTPSPTPTPTPAADLSSYFSGMIESGNSIMERPFTKSTNERGNDVYKGIGRNSSLPEGQKMTVVIELTRSQADAKQLSDQTVAQKINEGFTLRTDWITVSKANNPNLTEDWEGMRYATGQQFVVRYHYDPHVSSWLHITQAG